MHPTIRLACLALSALFAFLPRPAAAETSQACTGFIDRVPATVATQGNWCLRADLSTNMGSGAAITIAANNVTIDCNGFKLGNLAAGDSTQAEGIKATATLNATVRNCNVRGFLFGTRLTGHGHAVLDSRFDNNTYIAILVDGDGSMVRGNRISDTGGSTSAGGHAFAYGIYFAQSSAGTVQDNFIQGVYASAGTNAWAYGVIAALDRGEVTRNTIASLEADGTGQAIGIYNPVNGSRAVIRDNTVGVGMNATVTGIGMRCFGAIARDNTVSGFATGYSGCADAGGNFSN